MSGVEVIGLVAAIITILDGVATVSSAIKDANGLPRAFREVDGRLPLAKDILESVEGVDPNESCWSSMELTVKNCHEKADYLKEIFDAVKKTSEAPLPRRYYNAVKNLGKGKQVETLMRGILEDVQLLAGRQSFNTATKGQIKELADAIEVLSKMPSSVPDRYFEDSTHSNVQNIASGGKGVFNDIEGENNIQNTYMEAVTQHYGRPKSSEEEG